MKRKEYVTLVASDGRKVLCEDLGYGYAREICWL